MRTAPESTWERSSRLSERLCSRSTCSFMRARYSCRSAGSTPSSSSSSRKPESENNGVLNSCDALATKSRRARSTRACWVTSRSTAMESMSVPVPTGYARASRVRPRCSKTAAFVDDAVSQIGPDGRELLGEGLRDRRAGVQAVAQEACRGGVVQQDGAVRADADDALAEGVEHGLGALLLVLDGRERFRQAATHDVEGGRQLAYLVARVHRQGDVQVAAGDGLGAALDALQAPRDEERRHEADDEGDAHGEGGREQDLLLCERDRLEHVLQRR